MKAIMVLLSMVNKVSVGLLEETQWTSNYYLTVRSKGGCTIQGSDDDIQSILLKIENIKDISTKTPNLYLV